MPIYSFTCRACNKATDLVMPLAQRQLKHRCKVCGSLLEPKPTSASFRVEGYSAKNRYSDPQQ